MKRIFTSATRVFWLFTNVLDVNAILRNQVNKNDKVLINQKWDHFGDFKPLWFQTNMFFVGKCQWMPEKWSIKSVVEDQRLMKLHECACEMISKVSENKDLKPHECGRSTLSEAQRTELASSEGLKKPHFLHLQFCTCNNSFPRIPSRHNFCLKESPEFQTLWL